MQNDKPVEALEPCAHCDSGAHETEIDRDEWCCASVVCMSCLARGPVMMLSDYASEDEAIKAARVAWNRRATLLRSDDGAGVLPCDVRLPPATTIRAGCSFETLRSALSTEGRPVHFSDAHPPAAVAGEGAKYAEMSTDEKAVAMADDCVGDPWELLGYFRTKLEQAERESIEWKERAMSLRPSQPAADALGTGDGVPDDVVALVCAGRRIMERGYVSTSIPEEREDADALDKALKAFASRVCWDDDGGTIPEAHADPCTCGRAALSEAPSAGEGIKNIRARADAIAHLTVPEDGNYRSNGQYKREWRIARDAARTAFEEIAAHPTPVEPVGHWHGKDADDMLARFRKKDAEPVGLREAALALRDDMLMRAKRDAWQNDGEIVVEAGAGVWARFNAALTRTDEASTDGEGWS